MPRSARWLVLLTFLCFAPAAGAEDAAVVVELDATEVPALHAWGEKAQQLIVEWHPRVDNLLPSKGYAAPRRVRLKLKKSATGVAATSGNQIEVSSHWIEKHPEDIGLIVHELTHVVQAYPKPDPGWLVEGIADYIRWAIYEGKPAEWFPVSAKPQGYKDSYRVAGGFLLWLERDRAPGIVNKLNAALRRGTYSATLFEEAAGQSLDALWDEYRKDRTRKP